MTNHLDDYYRRLSQFERLIAQTSALAHNDVAETARLSDSAPLRAYRLSHHWGLAEALTRVAALHLIRRLERAGSFWLLAAAPDDPAADVETALLLCARSYRSECDGWHEFCRTAGLAPDAFPTLDEPADLLTITDRAVAALAPPIASLADPREAATPAAIAADYRRLYRVLSAPWRVPT